MLSDIQWPLAVSTPSVWDVHKRNNLEILFWPERELFYIPMRNIECTEWFDQCQHVLHNESIDYTVGFICWDIALLMAFLVHMQFENLSNSNVSVHE